jgi:hypothetical protein
MIMKRVCENCGKPFETKRSHAKTCSSACRGKLAAKVKRVGLAPPIPNPSPDRPSLVFDATQQALVQAGRLNTPLGAIALVVAGRLDGSEVDTGSGVVALSRELDRLLAGVLAENEPPDELDELTERRRRKAARAAD